MVLGVADVVRSACGDCENGGTMMFCIQGHFYCACARGFRGRRCTIEACEQVTPHNSASIEKQTCPGASCGLSLTCNAEERGALRTFRKQLRQKRPNSRLEKTFFFPEKNPGFVMLGLSVKTNQSIQDMQLSQVHRSALPACSLCHRFTVDTLFFSLFRFRVIFYFVGLCSV